MKTAQEAADDANARLLSLYLPILEKWRELRRVNARFSIPGFLKTRAAYFTAKLRLVFVGQETHGWFTNCPSPLDVTADAIMDFYQSNEMTDHRTRLQSPYWRLTRKIASSLGLSNLGDSVMTSNLFPCDCEKRQAPEELLKTMRTWKLLPEELKILRPHVVVFFAGREYSYNLEYYFGQKVEPPLSTNNLFQEFSPPTEKWKGVVTYHPNGLQHMGRSEVTEGLIQAVRTLAGPEGVTP